MPKRVALTLIYLGRGVVFLALLYLPLSETGVIIYAAILGFLWLGTIPLTSGLIVTLLRTALAVDAVRHRVFLASGRQLYGRVARRLAV